MPGLSEWDASGEALYVAADVGQTTIKNVLNNKTVLKFRFVPKPGTGLDKWEGDGFIMDWELSGPLDDAAAVSIEIRGTGQLVPGSLP
ncbi:MAG: phage tail tube protein [Pseudarthrobacter sp.]